MGQILSYRSFLKTYKTRGHKIRHLKKYENLFPIKANKRLAGIIADLICDGNLQGNPKWRIDFTSKSIEELKRFEKEISILFNKRGKVRECKTNKSSQTYNLAINCSPVARILFLCGVPSGQKVLQEFGIPAWIKVNKKCFKIFARRVFSCEGSIMHEKKRKIPQIRINMQKAENIKDTFLVELASYLKKHFNISSSIRKQNYFNLRKDGVKTTPTRMYITGESVFRFCKKVGFEGTKQERLMNILGLSGSAG